MSKSLDELKANIEEMEKQLAEAKKEYREMSTAGQRDAIEARKAADEAVKEELKNLGYSNTYSYSNPFISWRNFQVSPHKIRRDAIKHGYRSGLEHKLSIYLDELKHNYLYEEIKIEWEDLSYRTYTPDFVLNNGIIIETKGRFLAVDRRKHLAIQKQHPKLDIRFVFTNSRNKLRKGAKSTYADWCIKYGFRYYDRIIPEDWLKEKGKNKHPKFIKFMGTKVRRK